MGPIGVFDSGYGGLTVLRSLVDKLPAYDYLYLGDNARAPYGTRSFDTVYRYTLECVRWLLAQDCPLIILACNTASAKALRTIQQNDLEKIDPTVRVLGVLRPTTEVIGEYSRSGHIGILATRGTVQSQSYPIEIAKFFPHLKVVQEACPIWVPLIENQEHQTEGADYFVRRHVEDLLQRDGAIDTLLLACTHYPLLAPLIRRYLPQGVQLLSQGSIVAASLESYLRRHPGMDARLNRGGSLRFFTTDDPADFNEKGALFFGSPVTALHADLDGK
jgi:glutamate racemase